MQKDIYEIGIKCGQNKSFTILCEKCKLLKIIYSTKKKIKIQYFMTFNDFGLLKKIEKYNTNVICAI